MTLALENPSQQTSGQPTAQELLRLLNEGGVEFIDGQLVEHFMSKDAANASVRLSARVNAAAERDNCFAYSEALCYRCFLDNPGLYRKPDASVIRRANVEALGAGDLGIMPIPADLAVEVVSPDDNADDLDEKIALYLANGFGQVWVVFPATRILYLHRPGGDTVGKFTGDMEITAPDLLPSLRFKLSELFA